MKAMNTHYIWFYLLGRDGKKLKADIDTEKIAEDVASGKGTIHELLSEAVTKAARAMDVDKSKRRWAGEYEDEIREAGGDSEAAYDHFCQGRIDEAVGVLEGEVLNELEDEYGDDSDDDDSEDGEEDE